MACLRATLWDLSKSIICSCLCIEARVIFSPLQTPLINSKTLTHLLIKSDSGESKAFDRLTVNPLRLKTIKSKIGVRELRDSLKVVKLVVVILIRIIVQVRNGLIWLGRIRGDFVFLGCELCTSRELVFSHFHSSINLCLVDFARLSPSCRLKSFPTPEFHVSVHPQFAM